MELKPVTSRDLILSDRERKNLAILEVIRKHSPISRTDISKHTELNIVTVSNYVDNFIERGLVIEKGFDISSGGRRPTLVELNGKAGHVVAVGLTMMHMVGIVVDLETKVVLEMKKDRPPITGEVIIDELVRLTHELIKSSKVNPDKIFGIGIGLPGIIDETGRTIRWPGKLGSQDVSVSVSVKDIFEKEFGLVTIVENDATAAVLGEKWFGLEPEIKNMIYMYSGVGCGVIINGQVYRGSKGTAGELGIFNPNEGDPKTWERDALALGRWEMDLGIIKRARLSIADSKSKILALVGNDPERITPKTIIDAAKAGDELAIQLITEAGKNFGKKIAFLVNFLNPEVIVIGGGIEQFGTLLIDSLRKTTREWAIDEATTGLRIIPAQLGENAVPFGAASLVIQQIFIQV